MGEVRYRLRPRLSPSPWGALVAISVVLAPGASAQQPSPSSSADGVPLRRALLDQYCVGCHNQRLSTAGVSLEGLDLTNVDGHASVLERVLRKVRTGQMPPPGLPHPDASVAVAFANSLQGALDRAAAANPNPGRPAVHRLNRAEYSNAIRDLLALDIKPGSLLPVDDSGYGFDNIGDLLSVSPALLERYLSAARRVSRLAVGDPNLKPVEEEFTARRDGGGGARATRNERVSDDLPFDSRGGLAFQYYFPLDAEYIIRVKTGELSPIELRQPIKAGLRTVGVTFLRESTKVEATGPAGARRGPAPPDQDPHTRREVQLDLRLDGVRLKRFPFLESASPAQVSSVIIAGPYNATGPGDTPSRARVFVCRPATSKDEEPCARMILSALSRRAFRRPVTDADLKPLLAFYQNGRRDGDFENGIEKAVRAMLASPDFLFRVEHDPPGTTPGSVYRISDLELASRLSFFLWSSIPDDELLHLAEKGKLKDPLVLEQQVRRMLDDPRSDSLVTNFAGQWLYIRNMGQVKPDPDAFPEFDESLRQSFQRETELFFQNILREDRSVMELLDANYTFLNQRLAEHYGIPNIYGSQLRKVALTDPNRGGLLGQGSILTVTSYPNRTSVVQRGKWILDNLLGTPPPPPPPDIPELKAHAKDGKLLTMREQMEQHRTNAICAGCHARMDPIGFALENYDGVGKWRAADGGSPIDASGKLPGGVQFNGPAGLKKLLLANYRDDFVGAATEKLLTYALGRGLEYYDKPAVRSIMRQAGQDNYRMSALITAVVRSTPFQMRRAPER
jgi:mono/diheme cytochrome c family protein